jgi:hypothetical protein
MLACTDSFMLERKMNEYNAKFIDIAKHLNLSDWSMKDYHNETKNRKLELRKYREDDDIAVATQKVSGFDYTPGPVYQKWKSSRESLLLLLIGVNDELAEGDPRRHCWVSIPAFKLRDELCDDSSFHATFAFSLGEHTSIFPALCKISIQLLRCKQSVVCEDEYFGDLLALLIKYHQVKVDRETRLAALKAILLKTMTIFEPDEVVYIIVDRVDQCEEHGQDDMINVLLDMASSSKCVLKILVVAKKTYWKQSEWDFSSKSQWFRQSIQKQDLLKEKTGIELDSVGYSYQ